MFQLVSITFLVFFVYYIKVLFWLLSRHLWHSVCIDGPFETCFGQVIFIFWGIGMELRTHRQLSQISLNPQRSCLQCFRSMFIYIFIIFLKKWNFWRNCLQIHLAIFLQQIAAFIWKAVAWWKLAFEPSEGNALLIF